MFWVVLLRLLALEPAQRQTISVWAEPGDLPNSDRRDHRPVPELFTGVDIRDMDFDDGPTDRGERIAQGDAIVGQAARVDDDTTGLRPFPLDEVDQLSLVI